MIPGRVRIKCLLDQKGHSWDDLKYEQEREDEKWLLLLSELRHLGRAKISQKKVTEKM